MTCAALVAATIAGCGSTKKVTVTHTATQTVTASPTASSTTTALNTTSTAPPSSSGSAPALNGTYTLNGQPNFDGQLPTNPHDGVEHADSQWITLNGACAAHKCQVKLRRVLSDNTIESLTLTSHSPAAVYTGAIPGGDGTATCGGPIHLSMIVRVGGLQSIGGETIATKLAGHIFADFTCPGSGPTHDVSTYTGVRSS